jgi:hypothetical protein
VEISHGNRTSGNDNGWSSPTRKKLYSRETSFLGHFQAEWAPVGVKKLRQIRNPEPRFYLIEKEKALDHAGDAAAGCEARRG